MTRFFALILALCVAAPCCGQSVPIKSNFVEQAPVVLISAAGRARPYGVGKTSAADVGVAALAAKNAAVAGDKIMVYRDATASESWAKDGVDWWFAQGVTISATTSASGTNIFDDGGSAMSFTVDGAANFVTTLSGNKIIAMNHDSSVVRFRFASADAQYNAAGGTPCVHVKNGTLYVDSLDFMRSAAYDTIWAGDVVASGAGNDGIVYVRANRLLAGDDCIETDGGTVHCVANLLSETGTGACVNHRSGNTYVTAARMAGTVGATSFGGTVRLSCPNIEGTLLELGGTINGTGISLQRAGTASAARDTLGATSGVFPLSVGGLGATTASGARDTLGATSGVFPITAGGTGASTAAAARTALDVGKNWMSVEQTQASSPADGQTLYIYPNFLLTSESGATRLYPPVTGTITRARVQMGIQGVLGTTEATTVYLRKNGTTDYQITNALTADANSNTQQATGLSIPVTDGDYFTVKIVCPTWATNPTNVTFRVDIEVTK